MEVPEREWDQFAQAGSRRDTLRRSGGDHALSIVQMRSLLHLDVLIGMLGFGKVLLADHELCEQRNWSTSQMEVAGHRLGRERLSLE